MTGAEAEGDAETSEATTEVEETSAIEGIIEAEVTIEAGEITVVEETMEDVVTSAAEATTAIEVITEGEEITAIEVITEGEMTTMTAMAIVETTTEVVTIEAATLRTSSIMANRCKEALHISSR